MLLASTLEAYVSLARRSMCGDVRCADLRALGPQGSSGWSHPAISVSRVGDALRPLSGVQRSPQAVDQFSHEFLHRDDLVDPVCILAAEDEPLVDVALVGVQ